MIKKHDSEQGEMCLGRWVARLASKRNYIR